MDVYCKECGFCNPKYGNCYLCGYEIVEEVKTEFKDNDYVMVKHPDYQELGGLARVIKPRDNVLRIEFCEDKTMWLASTEFLRHATEEEIRAASKS
ncbi:hypothetical protein ACX16Y_28795 [Bacillus cereus]